MKSNIQVYLAGPISSCSYKECTDWRQYVQDSLPGGIVGMSPMRHKHYLQDETMIDDSYEESVLSSQRGLFARDTWDISRVDAVFVNLLGADKISIGTVMEIAWAWQLRKPTILIMESQNNIHEHAMIREACPLRVETIDEGIDLVEKLFFPGFHN